MCGNIRTVVPNNQNFRLPTLTLNNYYPYGMLQAGRSKNAGGYRFGFQGQEADNKIGGLGQHTTAQFWEYDTWAVKRWNVDPVIKYHMSGYAVFANNPICFIDPMGDDWYVTNTGKEKGSYVWFDGSEKQDGHTHVGEYKVVYNVSTNLINVYHGKESDFIESLDMNALKGKNDVFLKYKTERASKFALISSESGGLAFKDNNIFIDALIISASIDNRQKIADSDKKLETYYATYKGQKYKGFQAASATSYKDFKKGNKSRFNGNLFSQNISLASVYNSLDEPILKLETLGMIKARFIVYYAHKPSEGQKGTTAYRLEIPNGTDRMGPVQGDTKHDSKLE